MTGMAIVLAGLGLMLLIRRPPPPWLRPARPGRGLALGRCVDLAGVAGIGVMVAVSHLIGPGWLAPLIVVGLALAWVSRRTRQDRVARHSGRQSLHICLGLAALLRAGNVPFRGLALLAREYPCLDPVITTGQIGGDVGAALSRLADSPGRDGLGALARAWRLSEVTGSPMADIAQRIAALQRARADARRVVCAELSAARSSARLMAMLPALGLLLGYVSGGDPLAFLLHDRLGRVCLLAAAGLASVGLVWTEYLATPGDTRVRGGGTSR